MSIEPIGIFTLALGIFGFLSNYATSIVSFVVLTILGASAALLIGSANIQPAYLFLPFASLAVLKRPREGREVFLAVAFPRPGFWFILLIAWAIASGFFFPRLFALSTPIYPLGSTSFLDTGSTVPLVPVSSNFNQSVYLAADLGCFCLAVAIGSTREGIRLLAICFMAYAGVNVVFAFLDLLTYSTGTGALLDFVRNARYTFHHEEEVEGLKRIVGSFPEASSFARSTLGAFAFCSTLWIAGRFSGWSGPLAILSFLLVVLSTSSAGLAALAPLGLLLFASALLRSHTRTRSPNSLLFLVFVPLVLAAAVLFVLLSPDLFAPVHRFVAEILLNKGTSNSAIERGSWNDGALTNFLDTGGFGVGLGTARTSGLAFALLGSTGLIGTVLYLAFIFSVLLSCGLRELHPNAEGDVRLAARNAMIALCIPDLLLSPSIDQGLLFFLFAGACVSRPTERTEGARTRMATRRLEEHAA